MNYVGTNWSPPRSNQRDPGFWLSIGVALLAVAIGAVVAVSGPPVKHYPNKWQMAARVASTLTHHSSTAAVFRF